MNRLYFEMIRACTLLILYSRYYHETMLPTYIRMITPTGCQCPQERRHKSRIVGCGTTYKCSFDTYECTICQRKFRYASWARQHQH